MHGNHPLTAYRLRQDPPLSRSALAAMLGVSRITIFRWETGEREIDVARLENVSNKTGIPAKELRPKLADEFEKLFANEAAE